jgi:hypothetical protein
VNPLEQVHGYLLALERRLRWGAITRGAAITSLAALFATVLLVLYANANAFSESSLRIARVLLVISLALAAGFGLLVPIMRLNRRWAARRAENAVPEFDARLLTFAEKQSTQDPFLEAACSGHDGGGAHRRTRIASSARLGCSARRRPRRSLPSDLFG